jgi:hypothetical protein
MLDLIYREFEQIANLQIFGVFFFLFLACSAGFQWRQKAIGKDVVTFDGRFWYTPQQGQELLEQMGASGRKVYAATQMTLDLFFPFVYGGLILILIVAYGIPRYFIIPPIITIVADLFENFTTTYLTVSYNGTPSPVSWVASAFTTLKWSALCLSVLVVVTGIIVFYLRR